MISTMALHRVFTVYRRASVILAETTVLAQITPGIVKCPQHGAYVELTLTGNGDGLVGTVTVKGDPADEVVPVNGPLANDRVTVRTCERFTCVDRLDFSGIASPATVSARLVGSGGEPVHINCELSDCVLGHLDYRSSGWPVPVAGAQEQGSAWIAFNDVYDFKPREGDVFVEADGTRWEVVSDPDWLGSRRPHHFEVEARRRQAADIEVRT